MFRNERFTFLSLGPNALKEVINSTNNTSKEKRKI